MIQAKHVNFEATELFRANNDDVAGLDEMLMKSIALGAVTTHAEKQSVIQKMSGPDAVTSPEDLLDIQQRTSDYNLQVSLISTLARKAVGAVETVLRA